MKEIHAHDVLDWIAASPEGKTQEEVLTWAKAELGAETTYYTCSRMGMKIEELVAFFVEAQKVVTIDGRMQINRQRMCSH